MEERLALQNTQASRDTILMTTPHGHEVSVEMDEDDFAVHHARVVNHYTGAIQALDEETSDILARALRAKHGYDQALADLREIERTLRGFGSLADALGDDHPALTPYKEQAHQHRALARDCFSQARHLHDDAMEAIDRLAEKDRK